MTRRQAPAWGEEPMRSAPATLERRSVVRRPYPPETCGEDRPECFVPDAALVEWIRDTFIAGSGPLANEDHAHLMDASLGALWTNAINRRQLRNVVATAEIPMAMGGGWKRGRHDYQLREWFGAEPDFLLTFSAPDCARMSDREFCAVVEHELYHCAQDEDRYGSPRFNLQGMPVYSIRGHDVEEFTGVVRRYGATSADVRALVQAAQRAPLFGGEPIAIACGTCHA